MLIGSLVTRLTSSMGRSSSLHEQVNERIKIEAKTASGRIIWFVFILINITPFLVFHKQIHTGWRRIAETVDGRRIAALYQEPAQTVCAGS